MPALVRAALAIGAITAVAGTFAVWLIWLLRVGTFHGPDGFATELGLAVVVPVWYFAIRQVVRSAIARAVAPPATTSV